MHTQAIDPPLAQDHWLRCNFISEEALQADIKLNACHCDKGLSNLLCQKRLLSGQEAADVLTQEDDTTSLAFVTFHNNAAAQMM